MKHTCLPRFLLCSRSLPAFTDWNPRSWATCSRDPLALAAWRDHLVERIERTPVSLEPLLRVGNGK